MASLPTQFTINIDLVLHEVKKVHLWYPPENNPELEPPDAPKGISKKF